MPSSTPFPAIVDAASAFEDPDAAPLVVVGESVTRTHQFTPAAVSAFSSSIGDTNPLHHDAAFAAASRFGRLIVSGTHTTALLMGLTAALFCERGNVVGVTFTVDLKRPVPATALVTLEWVVTGVRPHKGGPAVLVDLTGAMRDPTGLVCVAATGRVLLGFA